jgi:beta-lactamase regulating signal transducer with metallopeptidase domain
MYALTVKLLQMSLRGAVLILLTALIRRVTLRWLPKRMLRLLWLPALLTLLLPLPAVISLDMSVPETRGETLLPEAAEASPMDWDSWEAVPAGQTAPEPAKTPGESRALPLPALVWLCGAGLLGLCLNLLYLREYARLSRALPLGGGEAAAWLREHPLRRTLRLRVLPGLRAPMTYGVLRPVILLPEAPERYEAGLLLALEHEYMHVRHMDAAWKLLLGLVLAVHWFDPAVWLMYALLGRDMELGCDEAVLLRMGPEYRADFARMLVDTGARGRFAPFPALGAGVLRERVGSILRFRRAGMLRRGLALALVLTLSLCTVCTLRVGAAGEVRYTNGSAVLVVPEELKDLLLVETPPLTGESEEVLFRVLERETWEAGRELFPDSKMELGLLLTVYRTDETQASKYLRQTNMVWDLLARDDAGGYYLGRRTTTEANMLTSPETEDQSARWERRKLVNHWLRDLRSYLSWTEDPRTLYPAYGAQLSAYFAGQYPSLKRYKISRDGETYYLADSPAWETFAARVTWETSTASARNIRLPGEEPIVITRPDRDRELLFWEGSDLVLIRQDDRSGYMEQHYYTASLLDSPGEKVGDLMQAWYEEARASAGE